MLKKSVMYVIKGIIYIYFWFVINASLKSVILTAREWVIRFRLKNGNATLVKFVRLRLSEPNKSFTQYVHKKEIHWQASKRLNNPLQSPLIRKKKMKWKFDLHIPATIEEARAVSPWSTKTNSVNFEGSEEYKARFVMSSTWNNSKERG